MLKRSTLIMLSIALALGLAACVPIESADVSPLDAALAAAEKSLAATAAAPTDTESEAAADGEPVAGEEVDG